MAKYFIAQYSQVKTGHYIGFFGCIVLCSFLSDNLAIESKEEIQRIDIIGLIYIYEGST